MELRKSLEARKFKVPMSPNTIKNHILECYEQIRNQIRNELLQLKQQCEKFSLSFDEWTSTNNKRYINIIVHGNKKFWNTGHVRIRNSLTAENCIKIIEKRLEEFNLNLSSDFIAAVTDGASTMVKVGRLIRPSKTDDVRVVNDDDDDADYEAESDKPDDFLYEYCEKDYLEISHNLDFNVLINKVRKIVRLFRKSPQKNEMHQNYIKTDFGKELSLILDCKTRWNSLVCMVERFVQLEIPLKKTAIDLKIECLEESEYKMLKEVVQALKPIELAVKALCKRETNLCKADAALIFMLNEIKNLKTGLSNQLFKAVKKRVLERRTVCSTLLNFLFKGTVDSSMLEPNSELKTIKKELIEFAKKKFMLQQSTEVDLEVDLDVELIEVDQTKKLENALAASTEMQKASVTQSVSKMISLFLGDGNRGTNLDLAQKYLSTIPPTSVECERCFSTSGLFCNKIRTRLADETLDALVFLKSYFKNN